MTVTPAALQKSLAAAWCAATSYDAARWTSQNPAYGQCAVTACVVQDYLGGEIVWAEAHQPDGQKISHFFNRIGGKTVDLTRAQFPAGTVVGVGGAHPSGADARGYILSYPATQARYAELQRRVAQSLKGAA